MKIGIDLKYIRNHGRGGNIGDEMVQRNLLCYLAEVDREKEYMLYLRNRIDLSSYSMTPGPNITLRKMPLYHENQILRNILSLPRELRRNPVDLFHGSASLPFFSRGKKVMTMWEFSPLLYPQYFPRYVSMTRSFMYKKGIKEADGVITGSNFMKEEIVSYFGIDENKVAVINLGVEDRFFRKAPQEEIEGVKEHYNIKGPYLLSVGDLYPKKNIVRLISALNMLKAEKKVEENLVVVGSPLWKTGDLKGLDLTHVHFTGFVPDDHLPLLYQGARAFIFPSLYEGFGIPVLEAMASGIPMALSENTSFPEIAQDAAVYFDPFDTDSISAAVQDVVNDRAVRERILAEGRRRIHDFHWKDIVREYADLYATLCR